MSRVITFADALAEATCMAMARDNAVFMMGVGIDDPGGTFGSTKAPHDMFGDARVFDTPISECALTGMCVGAAMTGMRPILVHARNDFLLLTMDQIANHAAKWSYMSGGALRVPMLIRAIIGRGWGQAAQHSQSLQAIPAHFPGLQVIMPATPYDAKGMLLAALTGDSPVVCIEHRWSYGQTGEVPEAWYEVPIGRANVARPGRDATVVTISHMLTEAQKAAGALAAEGIDVEIVDLRTIRPWDRATIETSVRKTGHLVIADTGWTEFGIGSEIAASIGETLFGVLKSPIARIGLPAVPTPCAPALEAMYYPAADDIVRAVRTRIAARSSAREAAREPAPAPADLAPSHLKEKPFNGPF